MKNRLAFPHCTIRELACGQVQQASDLLVEGMLDNPLHIAAFGADPLQRRQLLARFLGHVARHLQASGHLIGAYVHGELVGVLGMLEPGRCRPGIAERLAFVAMVVASHPPGRILALRRWLSDWARNDPAEPHWHFGPLAVLPTHRRQGIGRRLMAHACAQIDESPAPAYLETDLAINAAFYQTLGFIVLRRRPVLGVPNWFMYRAASGSDGTLITDGDNIRPRA